MKTEKLSGTPVFPLEALSAWGDKGFDDDYPLVEDGPTRCLLGDGFEMRWASASTASTRVERSRSVMALAASNCTLPSLLVVVSYSQGTQAAATYSSIQGTTAM